MIRKYVENERKVEEEEEKRQFPYKRKLKKYKIYFKVNYIETVVSKHFRKTILFIVSSTVSNNQVKFSSMCQIEFLSDKLKLMTQVFKAISKQSLRWCSNVVISL